MDIRQGVIEDFSRLNWAWDKDYPTQRVYIDRIEQGLQEFWVIEEEFEDNILGEFHIVWDSPDPEEADAQNRAYLCAFRVHPDFRGQGLGQDLKDSVLKRVREAGRNEVTIGVKQDRPEIKKVYQKWGFNECIKTKWIDHHNFDNEGRPNPVSVPIELYIKYFD